MKIQKLSAKLGKLLQMRVRAERRHRDVFKTAVSIPRVNYRLVPSDGHNMFMSRFNTLSDQEWCSILEDSVDEPEIRGVHFPFFPDEEFQQRVHGHSGRLSMREAADFFQFIKCRTYPGMSFQDKKVLDFGCGWGRIARFFMKDVQLTNIYGYEPNFQFCALARILNPYVTFLTGPYLPKGDLPKSYFDLIVSWSVFSHISEYSARLWLSEMAQILTVGGFCVITTWGDRFLLRLSEEAVREKNGEEIHWYSKLCINKAGCLDGRLEEYRRGDYVWWDSINNPLYGEALISETALRRLIDPLSLRLVAFDQSTLSQDVFVLEKV